MSDYEMHVGKIRDLGLDKDSQIKFMREALNTANIIQDYKAPEDDEEVVDDFRDLLYDKYIVMRDSIWEVIEDKRSDGYEDINIITNNGDGTYSYINKFYNGGTCFSEMIEKGLEKLLKSEA